MYETQTIHVTATDGTVIPIVVPAGPLPSNERADYLRALYREHVRHPDGHWKGFAEACIQTALADDVAEAMDFIGSIVDFTATTDDGSETVLTSNGYWAHDF